MSKIARASRNASLMRVEEVEADKTILPAESGEVYLVDGSDDRTLTLPAVKAGAYIKVIISVAVGGAKTVTIQAAPNTVDILGVLMQQNVADHSAAGTDLGAAGDDKVVFGNSCGIGSYVELVCDGTKWYANGISHGGTLTFDAS
jgi:hypothetical protein